MHPQNPRRTATIIWAALVAGITAFFLVSMAVSMAVPMPGAPGLGDVLLPVAALLSIANAALSWLWAVRMRSPPGAPATPEALAVTRLIVASALCEGSALFGIVAHLVTRDDRMFLPFALSFVALLAHFPGDRHWARLCGASAARGPGRNPMIRG